MKANFWQHWPSSKVTDKRRLISIAQHFHRRSYMRITTGLTAMLNLLFSGSKHICCCQADLSSVSSFCSQVWFIRVPKQDCWILVWPLRHLQTLQSHEERDDYFCWKLAYMQSCRICGSFTEIGRIGKHGCWRLERWHCGLQKVRISSNHNLLLQTFSSQNILADLTGDLSFL